MDTAKARITNIEETIVPRPFSIQRRCLAALFVLSFAFDFRGTSGGSVIQFVMAGTNSIAFLLLAVSYRATLPKRGVSALVMWSFLLMLMTGSAGAMITAVPFGHYIRVIYPFALFLEGFLVAWWVAANPLGAQRLVGIMAAAAIVSLFFTYWWGLHFTGEGLNQIRYQILSPLIPFLLVATGYDLFFSNRRIFLAFLVLLTTLIITWISVTRGILLLAAFAASIVLAAWLKVTWSRYAFLPRPFVKAIASSASIAIWGTLIILIASPEILHRWLVRGFGVRHSISFWTRAAAVVGQYQQMANFHWSIILGLGFGNTYPWPLWVFPWIIPYVRDPWTRSAWFPGEFMWMTFLYYGGVIVGGLVIIALTFAALRAFKILADLIASRAWLQPAMRPAWIGILGYFAFLGMGFTSNPFILRLSALYMGLCLGITLAASRYAGSKCRHPAVSRRHGTTG